MLLQDYAIETPLKKSATLVEGNVNYEVKIDICSNKDIAAINFVLKVSLNLQPSEVLVTYCRHLIQYVSVKLLFSSLLRDLVLQDEETGAWYQHRGRDFKVALIDYLPEDGSIVGAKKGLGIWPGCTTYTMYLHHSVCIND